MCVALGRNVGRSAGIDERQMQDSVTRQLGRNERGQASLTQVNRNGSEASHWRPVSTRPQGRWWKMSLASCLLGHVGTHSSLRVRRFEVRQVGSGRLVQSHESHDELQHQRGGRGVAGPSQKTVGRRVAPTWRRILVPKEGPAMQGRALQEWWS